jgi:cytochrome c-type biogenesis protein CcmE
VGQTFRLAGMVREGSLKKASDSLKSEFIVTDNEKDLKVSYTGILPDLFKEGQGTVAKGKLGGDGVFYAEEVLAKHDESYMPPEVAAVMKPKGVGDSKPYKP